MEHRNVSYPFQSPPCWFYGSQKWERTRDPLAKRAGECLVISYFLEHGIWFFGCGCRQGCEWEYMPRECIPLLAQNCDTAGFCKKVHKSFFQTACRVQTEPRSLLPVTGPCRRLAQELWHDCKGRALSVTQLMGSTSCLQSQWPSPKLFPAWELLSWTGQTEILPPWKPVSSSSLCLLSSAATWIPSLTKVRYCWSLPALRTAMYFLQSSAVSPAWNSGFWANTNSELSHRG